MTGTERSDNRLLEDTDKPRAENLKLRSRLAAEVQRTMDERGWNQTEAAERFGVSRTRLNDILRGRIEKVTIDRLVAMLAAVGRRVRLSIEQTK